MASLVSLTYSPSPTAAFTLIDLCRRAVGVPWVVLVDEGARHDRPPHDGGEVLGRHRVQYAEGVTEALGSPRDRHKPLEHPLQHLFLLLVALVEGDLCVHQRAKSGSGASNAKTHVSGTVIFCACF